MLEELQSPCQFLLWGKTSSSDLWLLLGERSREREVENMKYSQFQYLLTHASGTNIPNSNQIPSNKQTIDNSTVKYKISISVSPGGTSKLGLGA